SSRLSIKLCGIKPAINGESRGLRNELLGAVDVSSRTALLCQMVPCKARDAVNGHSLDKSHNAAWRHLTRNPEGRARFSAAPRYWSFILNNHTSLLLPCSAQNQAPARSCGNVNR